MDDNKLTIKKLVEDCKNSEFVENWDVPKK